MYEKILVTGGAGFIGSNFIRHMLKNYPSYKIFNLDSLTYAGNLNNLDDIKHYPNYHFIKGDISDRDFVFSLFENIKFDVIVNFAAESHVDKSIITPDIFIKTNIQGTHTLLDASIEFNISRFHQVSTDEVYGDLPINRPDLLFNELTPLNPSSPYSASKAGADLLVMSYHRTFGLNVTISRCSNNYGPYHFPEKLIPLMIIKALKNESLPIYGDGKNIRDWLHVKDHCQAIDLIIHNGESGNIYNIGGHNEVNNLDVVKTILNHLGKPLDLISFVKDRPGHDLRYAIDPSKLETKLNFKAQYNFNNGIIETINWYLENENWWKNILSGEYLDYYKNVYSKL